MSFTIASLKGKIIFQPSPLLFWMRNVKYEPKSGIPESKPELYIANLEAPIFLVHRAALFVVIDEMPFILYWSCWYLVWI